MSEVFEFELGSLPPQGRFDQIIYLGWLPWSGDGLRRQYSTLIISPFDRVVVPLKSLILLFLGGENSIANFFTLHPEGLTCTDSGVFFQKDFLPSKEGLCRFTAADLDECRDRVRRDWRALIQACHSSRRTLFVRFEGQLPQATGEAIQTPSFLPIVTSMKVAAINTIGAVIESLFPELDFHLLVTSFRDEMNFVADAPPSRRVSFVRPDMSWTAPAKGNAMDLWQNLLLHFIERELP